MNKTFKVIFNHVLDRHVVVSEIASSIQRGKNKAVAVVAAAALTVFMGLPGVASAEVDIGENSNQNATASYTENPAYIGHLVVGKGTAVGADAVAVGIGVNAEGDNSVAMGHAASATESGAVAIGNSSNASSQDGAAFGSGARALGKESTALGHNTNAQGMESLASGNGAESFGGSDVALGHNASTNAGSGTAVGAGAHVSGVIVEVDGNGNEVKTYQAGAEEGSAFGAGATVYAKDGTALGSKSLVDKDAEFGLAVGYDSKSKAKDSIAIGHEAEATSEKATAIGEEAKAEGDFSTSIGHMADAKGKSSIAFGKDSFAELENSIAFGTNAKSTVANGVALGSGSIANTPAGVSGWDPKTNDHSTDTTAVWKSVFGAVAVGGVDSDNNPITRQITGVAAGYNDTDAANVAQLKAAMTHYYSVNTTKETDEEGNNNYANDGATAGNALAAGVHASASGGASTAMGYFANATGEGAVAIGNAKLGENGTVAYQTEAAKNEEGKFIDADGNVVGTEAEAARVIKKDADGKPIADNTVATGSNSIAIGTHTQSKGEHAIAIGTDVTVPKGESIGIGHRTNSSGLASTAVGVGVNASGDYSSAYGNSASATGNFATAIGNTGVNTGSSAGPDASNIGALAVGNSGTTADGEWATAVGNSGIAAHGQYSVVVGNSGTNTTEIARFATAIGNGGTTAAGIRSVAIGASESSPGSSRYHFNTNTVSGNSNQTYANFDDAVAVGTNAHATNYRAVGIGMFSNGYGSDSVSVGSQTSAGVQATALGYKASASKTSATAIGDDANASEGSATAIGNLSRAHKQYATAVGHNANSGQEATAVGHNSKAEGYRSVAIGHTDYSDTAHNTNADGGASAQDSIAIGTEVKSSAQDAIAIGRNSKASSGQTVAIGYLAQSTNTNAVTIGTSGTSYGASGSDSVSIGTQAKSTSTEAIAIGKLANAGGSYIRATQKTSASDNSTASYSSSSYVSSGSEQISIGYKAKATGTRAIWIGSGTIEQSDDSAYGAYGQDAVALGTDVKVFERSVGIGTLAEATHIDVVALGTQAKAYNNDTVAVGINSRAVSNSAIAIGNASIAGGSDGNNQGEQAVNAIAIGVSDTLNQVGHYEDSQKLRELQAYGKNSVAIGVNTKAGKEAVGIGLGNKSHGTRSVSIGTENNVGERGVGIGDNSKAVGGSAVAVGTKANAYSEYAVAQGYGAKASWHAVAVGNSADASKGQATSLGSDSQAAAERSTSIGYSAKVGDAGTDGVAIGQSSTNAEKGVTIGTGNYVSSKNGIAIGTSSQVAEHYSYNEETDAYDIKTATVQGIAIGTKAEVHSDYGIVVGTDSQVTGQYSVAVGYGHRIYGDRSGAFGDPDEVSGSGSYAFGNNNTIPANNAFVLGNNGSVTVDGGVAIGHDSKGTVDKGILGLDPLGDDKLTAEQKESSTWTSTEAAISVGSGAVDDTTGKYVATKTRQITNVAAGTNDTDAVNVAQLKRAIGQAGGTHYFGADDSVMPDTYINGNFAPNIKLDNNEQLNIIGDAEYNENGEKTKDGNIVTSMTTDKNGIRSIQATLNRDLDIDTLVVNGKNGKDGTIGINGEDGQTTTISVTTDGTPGVDGQNGITRIEYKDPEGNDHEVATLEDGMKYSGDFGNTKDNPVGVKLNNNVDVVGNSTAARADDLTDGNIGVVAEYEKDEEGNNTGNAKLTVKLNKDINLGSDGSLTVGGNTTGTTVNAPIVIGPQTVTHEDGTTTDTGDYITGLDNTEWDPLNIVSGRAATEDQLQKVRTPYYSVNDKGAQQENFLNDGATGTNAMAAGTNASATGHRSVAVGDHARVTVDDGVAIGSSSLASTGPSTGGYDVITGATNYTDNTAIWTSTAGAVSVGGITEDGKDITRQIINVAAGTNDTDAVNVAQLKRVANAVSIHDYSVKSPGPDDDRNYDNSGARGANAMAAGVNASAAGNNATAVGNEAIARDANSTAVGNKALASADSAVAIGDDAQATKADAIAIGTGTRANHEGSVAIGAGAQTAEAVGTASYTINGKTYNFAGTEPVGTVSVGTSGNERTITNVAAGRISETSTDAINGSQLYALAEAVNNADSRHTEVTVNGGTTAPSDGSYTDDGGNLQLNQTTGDNGQTVYDLKLAEDLNVGTVVINGKDGKDGLTIKGADGEAGSIGMAGKDGEITHITVTNDGTPGVDGQDGITRIEYRDPEGNDHTVATLEDGMKYTGDFGDGAEVKLNNTVNVVGEATTESDLTTGNIGVVAEQDGDNGKLTVKLNKDIDLTGDGSVTTGDTVINNKGMTINEGPTITKNQVDVAGNQIKNVAPGTDGTDAVNVDQLKGARTVVEAGENVTVTSSENTETGAITYTVSSTGGAGGGQSYGGDTGDVITKKAKEQVNVVGGITDEAKLTTEDNIGVVSDGKDNLKVRLAKDVKGVDTVQVNNNVTVGSGGNTTKVDGDGVAIANGPTITRTTVSMNNQQIHDVAPGTAPTDAVNVSQLNAMGDTYNKKLNHLHGRISEVDKDASAGVAMALAAASLPQVYLPGKNMMAVAGGTYRGESGFAIGFSSSSDDGKWIIKANATTNSQGHYGAAVGAGYMW